MSDPTVAAAPAVEEASPAIGTAVAAPKRRLLGKKDILAAKDILFEEVHVPEWASGDMNPDDCFVVIKTLNGKERDAFEASMIQGIGRAQRIDVQNVRAKFCSLIIVDPDTHERMFLKPDIETLALKSSAALDRVYAAGMKLSKFSKEDIDEIVGNSDADQPVV